MNKATQSKDGVHRIAMWVEYRLSRDDLIVALASNPNWDPEKPSKKPEAEQLIRESLVERGRNGIDWWFDVADENEKTDREGRVTAAEQLFAKHFGNLIPTLAVVKE